MIEGGKASVGPQMGQSLAPLGVNLQDIINQINEKTASFNGMKVPVKIIVETEDKSFELEIGTPPVSELIKKEIGVDKGSGVPNKNKVGNLSMEQIVKIAQMKQDSLLFNNFKSAVKSIIGSCNSAGVLVESKFAPEVNKEIEEGKYDDIINNQKTEPSEERKAQLQKELKTIQAEIKKEIEREEAEKKAEEEKAKELAAAAEEVTKEPEEGEEAKEDEEKPTEGEEGAEAPAEGEKPSEESPDKEKKE
jgi:large subunit ribosomal protein L11